MHISQKVRGVLKHRNIRKADLARKANLSPAFITRLCKGKVNNPSCLTIQKIAKATKVNSDWFIRDVDFTQQKQRD